MDITGQLVSSLEAATVVVVVVAVAGGVVVGAVVEGWGGWEERGVVALYVKSFGIETSQTRRLSSPPFFFFSFLKKIGFLISCVKSTFEWVRGF